jgi:hypothetical protein
MRKPATGGPLVFPANDEKRLHGTVQGEKPHVKVRKHGKKKPNE